MNSIHILIHQTKQTEVLEHYQTLRQYVLEPSLPCWRNSTHLFISKQRHGAPFKVAVAEKEKFK